MNPEELFIGDYLKILSSGKIGRFHGIHGERIKVKIGDEICLAEPGDLELVPDEVAEQSSSRVESRPEGPGQADPQAAAAFPVELDLHLEALEGSGYTRFNYETILDFQLRICKNFIGKAKESGVGRIRIIHGKGEGILKAQVAHLLEVSGPVTNFEPEITGGAFIAYL